MTSKVGGCGAASLFWLARFFEEHWGLNPPGGEEIVVMGGLIALASTAVAALGAVRGTRTVNLRQHLG